MLLLIHCKHNKKPFLNIIMHFAFLKTALQQKISLSEEAFSSQSQKHSEEVEKLHKQIKEVKYFYALVDIIAAFIILQSLCRDSFFSDLAIY